MDDSFLNHLRCPIDPRREATLTREDQILVCSGCACRFPMKQGLPILIPGEAEMPAGCESLDQLPCVRAAHSRRKRQN